VLGAVRAADINPSEAAMRAGRVREFFPLTFRSSPRLRHLEVAQSHAPATFAVPYERRLSLRPVWLTVGRT
jgi:hypothetical protein